MNNKMHQIPENIAALTADWLTNLLQEHGHLRDSRITSFQLDRADLVSGFFGDIARINMAFEKENPSLPTTMLVKLPTQESGAYEIGLERGYYEREARFYTELGQSCGIRVPECYAAAVSENGQLSVLLLEDLSSYRLASLNSQSADSDALSVMTQLGIFHAKSWNDTAIDAFTWLPGTNAGAERFKNDFGVAWNTLCERLSDGHFDYSPGEKVIEFIPKIKHLLEQNPRAFLHADLRDENIFFDDRQNAVMIVVDWQHCRKGRGPFDVATYMFGKVGDMNVEQEKRLVEEYYASLVISGVGNYSIADCVRDYYLAMVDRFVNVGSTLAKVSADSDGGKKALEYLSRCRLSNFLRYSQLLLSEL